MTTLKKMYLLIIKELVSFGDNRSFIVVEERVEVSVVAMEIVDAGGAQQWIKVVIVVNDGCVAMEDGCVAMDTVIAGIGPVKE